MRTIAYGIVLPPVIHPLRGRHDSALVYRNVNVKILFRAGLQSLHDPKPLAPKHHVLGKLAQAVEVISVLPSP